MVFSSWQGGVRSFRGARFQTGTAIRYQGYKLSDQLKYCLTLITWRVIINLVIQTFRDQDTEKVFARQHSRKLPPNLLRVAYRKLAMIDSADSIQDLRLPPGNRLEKLSGNRKGQYSIRINDQWRICFVWKEQSAFEVEITDYHE
jgi:proteic killer suppression protein